MRLTTLLRLFTACLLVLGALFIFRGFLAQSEAQQATPAPIYNPYPPGILPADLNAEIARVLREIDVIEEREMVGGAQGEADIEACERCRCSWVSLIRHGPERYARPPT